MLFRMTMLTLSTVFFGGATAASAQEFPTHPLRMIVPVSAGGGADVIARVIAKNLQKNLGQPVIVDNRPGADTIIGTQIVATSAPDGYTLLLNYSLVVVQPSLRARLPYDLVKDLAPVINLMEAPSLAAARQSLPVSSIRDLLALAKEHPGKLTYGEGGTGGPSHLAAELFDALDGVKMLRVSYKGSEPALIDLAGGHIDVSFSTIVSAVPFVRSRKVKPLAVTGSKRSPVFPELPTVAEAGVKDYEYVTWYGLFVRAGTPKPIIDRLYSEVRAIIMTNDVAQLFAQQGAQVVGSGPQEFSVYINAELKKWAQVVKQANIPMDD